MRRINLLLKDIDRNSHLVVYVRWLNLYHIILLLPYLSMYAIDLPVNLSSIDSGSRSI